MRRRPNAFEVSFEEELSAEERENTALRPDSSEPTILGKRKSDIHGPNPEAAFYRPRHGPKARQERADLLLPGEDPFGDEDDAGDTKPIRVLTDFAIYDPRHGNELVSLAALEQDDGVDRQFEAAGLAAAYVANEEDEGQEDDGEPKLEALHLRLGAILRFTFDWTTMGDPVWIETQFAWYILKVPTRDYTPLFEHFFTPRGVAQFVVSRALKNTNESYDAFLRRFTTTVDPFGRTYKEDHIWESVPELHDAIQDNDDPTKLKSSAIIKHILRKSSFTASSSQRPKRRNFVAPPNRRLALLSTRDIDLAVLKRENQVPTHVTPRIAELARGLVYEELVVVGVRPPPENKALKEAQKEAARQRLRSLVLKVIDRNANKHVSVEKKDRVRPNSRYVRALTVGGIKYAIGDFVVVPIRSRNSIFPDTVDELAPTSTIADYFWFAKIMYADQDGRVHVHWLQHSSQTMMEELGHPQELFFNNLCDSIPYRELIGKITVHESSTPPDKVDEYFVQLIYDIKMATYTSIDGVRHAMTVNNPPDNCPVCPLLEQREQEGIESPLRSGDRINGIAFGGQTYHYEDFVLYRADEGPAHVGYITDFKILPPKSDGKICTQVFVKRVGRVASLGNVLPQDVLRDEPLRTLDIFGGVGAFSMGLEEGSNCIKVTDIVEISPSAAKTAMLNFPSATVHNQCANEVLRYSIKSKLNQKPEALRQLYDNRTVLPPLGEFDLIIAGVPCQPHSAMNMYKKADDIKSNLILTALSFVDHFKPTYFYFENVPGFLRFTFDAVQAGKYKLEGGLPMGGLKLVVRALVDMKYQVRFSLLQAGHYGTPQRRHRFFLIAARDGYPLPEFPQPSHDFPDNGGLDIKLPIGESVRPFSTLNGTAPHPFVSIDDAISDLPRFDWKHPKPYTLPDEKQREMNRRQVDDIPAFACRASETYCGQTGAAVAYHHDPRTSYQEHARAVPTKSIQHFTRTFRDSKVIERIIAVPLTRGADYHYIPHHLLEWQTSNPNSALARKNFPAGIYGRLDETKFFPTVVTNIQPTAKQSRVLNPYCYRMVTVRELARSQGFPDHFVFESIGKDMNYVITMHRQIGNAVPLPVGVALGRELRTACCQKWLSSREEDAARRRKAIDLVDGD
ncbi:hypothetical protein H0H81_009679 [Sphagnurus paluster]|uniref:DNA (cytosine-5-)-methyltransferase n=1 Tax=Sphagnurus paluster TaxID=117069 RepID=A0A9P7FVN6_9AGAR|nr:hypothetical protein H0H81_009679 [Sphagnurus paluster]